MRISLFLNSTMSNSCVRPRQKNWIQQEEKLCTYSHTNKRTYSYEGSDRKQKRPLHSRSSSLNRIIKQFPDFLNAWYELQWLISSRTTLTQALDAAVKQIYSLSAVLLLYVTLLLLLAQVAGLFIILSSATSIPIGFQFMMMGLVVIMATAFKIMYSA